MYWGCFAERTAESTTKCTAEYTAERTTECTAESTAECTITGFAIFIFHDTLLYFSHTN